MTVLNKVSVYKCPDGVYETDPERAIAWHIVQISGAHGRDGIGKIDFSDALTVVKYREKIIPMLPELDV